MQNFNKILVFDMDGTIFDFYGVEGWQHYLDDLQDPTPYAIAKPFYNPAELNLIINQLRAQGWYIVVNTWLSKFKTEAFHAAIREVKLQRLADIQFPYDYFIATDYGVDKQLPFVNITDGIQIIVDDNADIRHAWNGPTIDATQNIIPALKQLLIKDLEVDYDE